jgi:hypothetical protein
MRLKRRTTAPDDPVRKGFGAAASLVDRAQRTLLDAVPTSRDPGVPLPEALDAFLRGLADVESSMASWKDESVAHEWTKCSEAIAESRAAALRLRNLDVELTFEQLNAQIGDVLYPLEAFVDAERSVRRR